MSDMTAFESATSTVPKTDVSIHIQFSMGVFGTAFPASRPSMKMKRSKIMSIVYQNIISLFLPKIKDDENRKVNLHYQFRHLKSIHGQNIDRLGLISYGRVVSVSSSAEQIVIGYAELNALESGAGQEGFGRVNEELELRLSEFPKYGEANKGKKAMSDSDTEKNSQSDSMTSSSVNRLDGKIDNRFDRIDTKVDSRFDRLDTKIDDMRSNMDTRFKDVINMITDVSNKIDQRNDKENEVIRDEEREERNDKRSEKASRTGLRNSIITVIIGAVFGAVVTNLGTISDYFGQ